MRLICESPLSSTAISRFDLVAKRYIFEDELTRAGQQSPPIKQLVELPTVRRLGYGSSFNDQSSPLTNLIHQLGSRHFKNLQTWTDLQLHLPVPPSLRLTFPRPSPSPGWCSPLPWHTSPCIPKPSRGCPTTQESPIGEVNARRCTSGWTMTSLTTASRCSSSPAPGCSRGTARIF